MPGRSSTSPSIFRALFGTPRPFLGVVHLLPLPGSPRGSSDLAPVLKRATADLAALERGGVDGFLVENFGDAPFHPGAVPPATVAAMTAAAAALSGRTRLPFGINVLRNDAAAAVSIAAAVGAAFVRVNVHCGAMWTDQGLIEGKAHETLRLRKSLGWGGKIFADVLVKHASPVEDRPPGDVADETLHRALADAIILTGEQTGRCPSLATVRAVREALPGAPLLMGSGMAPENVADFIPWADGFIVGTSLKRGGRVADPVDAARVRAFRRALGRGGA